jgi:YfiH family protein
MTLDPSLSHVDIEGLCLLTDDGARDHGVVVAFTDRSGGVSAEPWSTLNLSSRVGDADADVAENRSRVLKAAGLPQGSLVFMKQVHGAQVVEASPSAADCEGDVMFVDSTGVTGGVLTADCVPVVVLGDKGLSLIHAGWRGLVAGAIEAGIGRAGSPVAAWVGPSIRACCYEVGPDVVSAFHARALPVADSWHVDPGRAAFVALQQAGVERIAATNICTSCDRRFFSHRRDRRTGRQGAVAALV